MCVCRDLCNTILHIFLVVCTFRAFEFKFKLFQFDLQAKLDQQMAELEKEENEIKVSDLLTVFINIMIININN